MAELKTRPSDMSVSDFLNSIENESKRNEGFQLLQIFEEETQEKAVMWGPSIIGFGKFPYQYQSGKVMEWFPVGFSPRKKAHSIYLMKSFSELGEILKNLGKYKASKGCLYINKLADIDESVFRKMIRESYTQIMNRGQNTN